MCDSVVKAEEDTLLEDLLCKLEIQVVEKSLGSFVSPSIDTLKMPTVVAHGVSPDETKAILQEFVCRLYTEYIYDNFSHEFERPVLQDTRGGNCVYLSRLFLESIESIQHLDRKKCQLLIAKKYGDGIGSDDTRPHNHVMAVYDNFIVELAGGTSTILEIGVDSSECDCKACYDSDGMCSVVVIKKSTATKGEVNCTKVNLNNKYDVGGLKDEMLQSIADSRYARYQIRFHTGQTRIVLKIEETSLKRFTIYCGVGRFSNRGKKVKYVAPFSPQPNISFDFPHAVWQEVVREWLIVQLDSSMKDWSNYINLDLVMLSLSQWLLKFDK